MLQSSIPKTNTRLLQWTTYLLVLSLPFERIPSLSLGGANLRISQVLVIIATILWVRQSWNKPFIGVQSVGIASLAFFGLGLISWFNIIDLPRFLITIIGTALVFLAAYLISRIKIDVWRAMQDLIWVMFGVGLFGYYQFVADMVGLPEIFTGLREQYTKIVFGIPRVHATAIEPLYFAGMLMIPIITIIISILYNQAITFNPTLLKFIGRFKSINKLNSFLARVNSGTANDYLKWSLLAFFGLLFVLTLSKGAWLFMSVILVGIVLTRFNLVFGLVIGLYRRFKLQISLGAFCIFMLGVVAWFSIPTIPTVVEGFGTHLVATIAGESGTIAERQTFITDAWQLLENNSFMGISSGHYGVGVKDLGRGTLDGGYLITNNVYLEVWLEHGLLSLVVFLGFLIYPLIRLWGLTRDLSTNPQKSVTALILFWILIGYYLQWTTFSPIFIMPIFILLGLAYNLIGENEVKIS